MMHDVFWLTGLPCSGKTTIGKELVRRTNGELLDGDDLRRIFNNQDFSHAGRRNHMLSVAQLAYRFSKYAPVVVALVSPLEQVREEIKQSYPGMKEVYVKCSVEECERRDVKGMYAQARKGMIKNFTGLDASYDIPKSPWRTVNTERHTIDECVNQIMRQSG